MADSNVGSISYDVEFNTGKLLDGQRTIERSVNKASSSFDVLNAAAKECAKSIAGLFAAGAIVNELNQASKAAATFESSLSEISAIAGVTGKELEKLGDVAKGFASVGVSATQGADAIKKIGAARPEVLKSSAALKSLTDDIITLRDAGKVDMAQAVDAVVLSLNQFSAASSESGRFVNVLAAGAAAGASEIRDTSEALKDAGSTAYSVGASFESVNAALQILAAGGLKGSQAGNALRNIMLKLAETGDKTLMPSTVGLTGALENLAKKNMSAAEMIKFFGLENYNAAAAITQNIGKLGEMEKAITGTSEASKQAAIQNQTYQKQLEKMQASIESVRIELGEKLNPTLGKAAQLVSEFLNNRDQEGSAFQMALTGIGIAAQTTAAIIAGKLVSAMAASAGATVTATMANRAALAESVRVTAAELAQAQAAARVATATAAMGGSSTAAAAAQARLTAATTAATAAQTAYASSASAAGIALRGWGTLLGAMGGWVGVAVAALTILAFNWDKVSGAAESAANISENAAARIRKALSGASSAPMRDLIDGMGKAQKDLAAIDAQLAKGTVTELVGPRDTERQRKLTKEEIASLTERREALRGAVVDYGKAQKDLKASQIAGLFPDAPPTPSKPTGGTGGTTTAKTKGEKFDSQGYIQGLVIANADGLAKIDAQEKAALDDAKQKLEEKKISQQQYQQAVTLIAQAAEKDRQDLRDKDEKDLQDWLDKKLDMEEDAAQELADRTKKIRDATEEVQNLRMTEEESAQFDIVAKYRAQLEEYDALRQEGILTEEMYAQAEIDIARRKADEIKALEDESLRSRLQSAGSFFDQAAGMLETYGDNTSGTYKTLFRISKAFALADSLVSLQAAIMKASVSAPFPANLGAMAAMGSAGLSVIANLRGVAFGGGRQYGGAVDAESLYRVNETGAPEMFTASNGRQYMMPNTKGEVTAANKLGGGVSVVVNNYASGVDVSASQNSNGDVEITVQRAVAEVASQISSNSGVVWSAMKSSTSINSKL